MAEEQNSYYRETFGTHIICKIMHFKKEAQTKKTKCLPVDFLKWFRKKLFHIVLDLIPLNWLALLGSTNDIVF